jgi:Na+-translocating ferredoxin:NAD+ oxidoreductase RnfD subunit
MLERFSRLLARYGEQLILWVFLAVIFGLTFGLLKLLFGLGISYRGLLFGLWLLAVVLFRWEGRVSFILGLVVLLSLPLAFHLRREPLMEPASLLASYLIGLGLFQQLWELIRQGREDDPEDL